MASVAVGGAGMGVVPSVMKAGLTSSTGQSFHVRSPSARRLPGWRSCAATRILAMGRTASAGAAVATATGWPFEPMARTTKARPMAAAAATQMTAIRAGFIDGLRHSRAYGIGPHRRRAINENERHVLTSA